MTNEEQIIELLREIRDLQKNHFDRYKEYTEKVLEVSRQQDLERQRREEENREDLRRGTRGMWAILAIALLLVFFLRPICDWILTRFSN